MARCNRGVVTFASVIESLWPKLMTASPCASLLMRDCNSWTVCALVKWSSSIVPAPHLKPTDGLVPRPFPRLKLRRMESDQLERTARDHLLQARSDDLAHGAHRQRVDIDDVRRNKV